MSKKTLVNKIQRGSPNLSYRERIFGHQNDGKVVTDSSNKIITDITGTPLYIDMINGAILLDTNNQNVTTPDGSPIFVKASPDTVQVNLKQTVSQLGNIHVIASPVKTPYIVKADGGLYQTSTSATNKAFDLGKSTTYLCFGNEAGMFNNGKTYAGVNYSADSPTCYISRGGKLVPVANQGNLSYSPNYVWSGDAQAPVTFNGANPCRVIGKDNQYYYGTRQNNKCHTVDQAAPHYSFESLDYADPKV